MPRWFYYLLILAVFAPIISLIWGIQQEMVIFICSALSLIPLAALIGRTTEDLEYYVGPTAGGLLNATFGNAPELIIGIFALQAGLISVVKASIAGSVISNVLLVLGGALALGGWRWGRQFFSNRDAGQYSAMMVLALAGFVIPFFASLVLKEQGRIQSISTGIAVIMLVVYMLYLSLHIFHVRWTRRNPLLRAGEKQSGAQPRTTRDAPEEKEDDEDDEESVREEEAQAATGGLTARSRAREPERAKPPRWWLSALLLCFATIATAWNSELLVGAIEPVAHQLGWSTVFIGLVIIPIIGNAAEHSSALIIAYRDRVDLSMAIAAGSSIQVAVFVAPILVLVSLFGAHPLDLVFQPLELVLLALAVILFAFVGLDGESNWLEGVQLIAIYLMACVVFFILPG